MDYCGDQFSNLGFLACANGVVGIEVILRTCRSACKGVETLSTRRSIHIWRTSEVVSYKWVLHGWVVHISRKLVDKWESLTFGVDMEREVENLRRCLFLSKWGSMTIPALLAYFVTLVFDVSLNYRFFVKKSPDDGHSAFIGIGAGCWGSGLFALFRWLRGLWRSWRWFAFLWLGGCRQGSGVCRERSVGVGMKPFCTCSLSVSMYDGLESFS